MFHQKTTRHQLIDHGLRRRRGLTPYEGNDKVYEPSRVTELFEIRIGTFVVFGREDVVTGLCVVPVNQTNGQLCFLLLFPGDFSFPRTSVWNASTIFVREGAALRSTFEDVAVVLGPLIFTVDGSNMDLRRDVSSTI